MATVKLLDNILSKGYKTFGVDEGTSIESIIRKNVDENVYEGTLIECYDLETGKTYYAPIEDDTETLNAIVLVNGKDAALDYEVQKNDVVEIVITPAGGGNGWSWFGAVIGFFEGAFAGFKVTGQWWGALIGGVIGFFAGGIVGGIIADSIKIDDSSSAKKGIDSERLPDVRGATNQPLTNQPYPTVLGKHLAVPFIIGSPFNDISGAHGEENYINVLYCVGYGPLRITDLKLGDQFIAHNQRWSGNPNLKNIWSGTLYGTDENAGSGTDVGEITNVWKNNDVTIEILQQTPNEDVNYGAIYPYAKLQNDIKANVLFIADGTLEDIDKGNNISYKGLGLQNGLRNNPIYFSEQFPKSLKVELDFAQGLYKTRSETVDKVSSMHYSKIPMWIAIQWRVFSEDNDKADGAYAGEGFALPTYDYNRHQYEQEYDVETQQYKTKRYWHSFDEINSVNMGWSGKVKPSVCVDFRFDYVADTTSASYGYTLTIKNIHTGIELDGDFTVMVEYKRGSTSYYKTYTYPANTTTMSIEEVIHETDLTRFIGVRVISQSSSFGGGYASATHQGYTDIGGTPFYYPVCVCVGNGIKASYLSLQDLQADKAAHTGNDYPVEVNEHWLNAKAFNLQPLGGDDEDHTGINEFRCTTEVDLVAWAEANLRAAGDSDEEFLNKFKSYFYDSTNTTKSIEVRVVRISPNYIDETVSTNEHSAYKFNDLFTWTTLTSTMIDGNELLKSNNPRIIQKRPLSEEDMRKLCVIALKAKTDSVDQLSNTIKKFSCIAESFAPYYDKTQKKWFPENVIKKNRYVQLVTVDNKKVYQDITEQQYYARRQAGYTDAKCLPAGNNFIEQILKNVIDIPSHRDEYGRIYIPNKDMTNGVYNTGCDGTRNYCNNNVASVFLYAGIGPHLGNDALGYSQSNYSENGILDFNINSFTKWFLWAENRSDGSTYTYPGYHYNHDGEEERHAAGDLVYVYFTANAYIYQTELLENVLSNIAIAGQAVYTRDQKNRILIVIDKSEKYPVGLINQKNILKSSFSLNFSQLPSGIQVTFPDENDGYEQNQVYRMADGESEEEPLGAIEPYGFKFVTNNNQIWFLAGYVLANRILNREGVNIQLGMEGATYTLGDVVLVQSDTMLIGKEHGGRITQLIEDDNYIYGFVIDDVYHLDGSEDFGCVVMQPSKYKEFRCVTLRIASVGTTKDVGGVTYTATKGKTNTVLLAVNISKSQFDPNGNDYYVIKPEVGNILSFGKVGSITSPYRIVKIKPSEKQKYDLTLLAYNEGLYTCGQELPSFQNNMTLPDRSMENHFALSNNVTQDQLVKAIQESATQAAGMIDETLGSIPPVPSNISFSVDRDGLKFGCSADTTGVNNVDYILYEITRSNNSTFEVKGSYSGLYLFNRDSGVDGYPEREDLAYWKIRAKSVSMYADSQGQKVTSNWSDYVFLSNASLNAYGTWTPATPSFSKKDANEGGINFEWATATGANSRQLYGTNVYTVEVKYNNALRATLVTTDLNTVYTFNRASNVDGYPEKAGQGLPAGTVTLDNYTVKLTVTNSSGNTSPSAELGINYDDYKTWIPSAPVVTKSLAEENTITFEWTDNSDCYGTNYYTVALTGTQGSVPAAIYTKGFTYIFDRSVDGYPEKTDLASWGITVTAVNGSSHNSTSGSLSSINTSKYLTWIPPHITVNTEVLDRTAILTALYNANLKFYGTLKTRVQIKLMGNTDIDSDTNKSFNQLLGITPDSKYYIPEFEEPVWTVPDEDNEPHYRKQYPEVETMPQDPQEGDIVIYTGTTTEEFVNGHYYEYDGTDWVETDNAFECFGTKITHTLPLIGQTYRIFKEGNVFTGTFTKDVPDSAVKPVSPTEGQIIHYTGPSTSELTEGYYYMCVGSQVTPSGEENPLELGWYELDDGHYVLTTDTSVVSGTDYYEVEWEQVFNKILMVPTVYRYAIQLTNESGNLSNLVNDIEINALPTNISDVVHSHEHYKDLYVEKLSAINANLGMISQGGMGEFKDWKNFWALSDLSAEDSGVAGGVKKGSFRVGGDDQFLEVMPDPDHEGEYLITLQAGNITLTSGSDASFKQGTYIYDKIDPKKRLALTSTGMIAQQNISNTEVEDWVNMAEVRTDELGNMIITNADDAPVVGVGVTGTIYHFDDTSHPFYEEVGEGVTPSNPQSLSGNGAVASIDDDAIIKQISSSKCYEGTVQKDISSWTGNIVFFSRSNIIQNGDDKIYTDGSISIGYNTYVRQTKDEATIGSYLGLSQTQIDNGIFTEE